MKSLEKIAAVPLSTIGIASAIGGVLASITWLASYDSLSEASYILYQNTTIIPLFTTVIIVGVYIGCLLCYKYLESFAAGVVNDVKNDFTTVEEDEEE